MKVQLSKALRAAASVSSYYDECEAHDVPLNKFERRCRRVADALLMMFPPDCEELMPVEVEPDVQAIYDDVFKDIVERPNGMICRESLMNELSDFWQVLHNLSQVYSHVTGGMVSKPNTDPDMVCDLADDYMDRIVEEHVAEAVEEHVAEIAMLRKRLSDSLHTLRIARTIVANLRLKDVNETLLQGCASQGLAAVITGIHSTLYSSQDHKACQNAEKH